MLVSIKVGSLSFQVVEVTLLDVKCRMGKDLHCASIEKQAELHSDLYKQDSSHWEELYHHKLFYQFSLT